jgi:hypothetical protein
MTPSNFVVLKWTCIETVVKMNDVGKSNGELVRRIDGRLVSYLGPGFPKGKWVQTKQIELI